MQKIEWFGAVRGHSRSSAMSPFDCKPVMTSVFALHLHGESEKRNQFSFICIFCNNLTETGDFFSLTLRKV